MRYTVLQPHLSQTSHLMFRHKFILRSDKKKRQEGIGVVCQINGLEAMLQLIIMLHINYLGIYDKQTREVNHNSCAT